MSEKSIAEYRQNVTRVAVRQAHDQRVTALDSNVSGYAYRIDCSCGRQTFVPNLMQLIHEAYAHFGMCERHYRTDCVH